MSRTRQYFPCIHRIINFPTCLLASLLFPVTHVWVITGRNDRIQVRKYLVSLGFISPVGHWRQLFNSTTFRSVQGSYVNSLLSHILLGNRRSRLSKPQRAQTSFNVINSWKKRGLSLASGPLSMCWWFLCLVLIEIHWLGNAWNTCYLATKSLLLFEPPRIRVGSITVITHLKDNFGEQGIILGEYF